jgi:peptidyl-prolyl cis-trans isomerase C
MKFFVSLLLGLSLLLGGLFIGGCSTPAKPAEETKKAAAPATESAKETKAVTETKPAEVKVEVKKEAAPAKVEPAKEVKAETAEVKVEAAKEAAAAEVAVDPEKVVVTINGVAIREKEVFVECEKRADAQAAQMTAMGWKSDEASRKMMREQSRDSVLDMLVEKAIITEQLKSNKIEITDADIDARFLEILKDAGKTPEQAAEDLKQQNRTVNEFKEQLRWHVGIEKLCTAISKEKDVTEADAKQFYDTNPQYFQQPEQIRASHILIKTEGMDEAKKAEAKKKIEDILKKARDGEDFAVLAKTYTEDPGSKDTGGEYTFPKGKMVPEFENAAFALEVGKISDVVETQFGYHIIKLSEKMPAKTWGFDEVKAKILQELKRQKTSKFWQQYSGDVKKAAKIEWSPEEKVRREQKEKERIEQQKMAVPGQPGQPSEPQPVPPMPQPEQ